MSSGIAAEVLASTRSIVSKVLNAYTANLKETEVGIVTSVSRGVVRVTGLPHVQSEELLQLPSGASALAAGTIDSFSRTSRGRIADSVGNCRNKCPGFCRIHSNQPDFYYRRSDLPVTGTFSERHAASGQRRALGFSSRR